MAGLAKELHSKDPGLKLDSKKINSIFWADDIVLLTENRPELQVVSDYCGKSKLAINCKKTKCLIFNRTGRLSKEKICMNGINRKRPGV